MTNSNIDKFRRANAYIHTAKFPHLMCFPTCIVLERTYHGMALFLCAMVGVTEDNQPITEWYLYASP